MKTLLKRAALGLLAAMACALAPPAMAAVDCTTATTPNTLGTTANAQLEILQKLCAAQTGAGYADSGVAPLTQSFTAPGNTSAWTPVAGRLINVTITGAAAGLSVRLVRSFDAGSTWSPLTVSGQAWAVWTGNVSEQAWVETEAPAVPIRYRAEVTAIASGTATIRLSQ